MPERAMILPPGLEDPDGLSFTPEGAPIILWAEAGARRPYVHIEADIWEPVPLLHPSTGTHQVGPRAEHGTVWTWARLDADDEGPPPAGTVHGSSLQITRPSAGTQLVIQPYVQMPRLTAEGRCVARPQSEDPVQPWRIDDLDNQLWFELPEPGELHWL